MSLLFNDTITAHHFEKVVLSDGSTCNRRVNPFVQNLRCQISYEGDDSGTPSSKESMPQHRGFKVFIFGTNHGFRSGDFVVLKRNKTPVYEGVIGDPKIYNNLIIHTELSLETWRKLEANGV